MLSGDCTGTSQSDDGGEALFSACKGGALVPAAGMLYAGSAPNAPGAASMSGRWPPGALPGLKVFLQVQVSDATAPAGFSASNGLAAATR